MKFVSNANMPSQPWHGRCRMRHCCGWLGAVQILLVGFFRKKGAKEGLIPTLG
jgi:hypothetical protein